MLSAIKRRLRCGLHHQHRVSKPQQWLSHQMAAQLWKQKEFRRRLGSMMSRQRVRSCKRCSCTPLCPWWDSVSSVNRERSRVAGRAGQHTRCCSEVTVLPGWCEQILIPCHVLGAHESCSEAVSREEVDTRCSCEGESNHAMSAYQQFVHCTKLKQDCGACNALR